MPDLSDTVAKCRMGTAKKFYTSIASLSHTNKEPGNQTADERRRGNPDRNPADPASQQLILEEGVIIHVRSDL